MEVRRLETAAEREAAVPILRQLWPEADPAAVREWTGREDYTGFGAFEGNELVGVAGVLLARHLHHERVAWLYDLVVDEPRRGEGIGTALVEHVEAWARGQDCARLALASPLAKEGVHDYYEELGFERWGYVIETGL